MKCLYIPIRKIYGGAERRLTRIFNRLDGDDWRLVLFGEKDHIESFCNSENVNPNIVIAFDKETKVVEFLRHSDISLIWFFNFDKVIVRSMLFKSKKKKYLMTIANYYFSTLSFKTLKSKVLFYFVMYKSDIIDCLFPYSADILRKKFKKKTISVTPIPFTKPELYKPANNKSRTIVFAARLVEEKNVMVLLESVLKIKEFIESQKYSVIICGDGPLKEQMINYINSNSLNSIVEYRGNTDTSTIFPFSSIFVCIMTGENYPSQSLIEAISAGNYCIVGKGKDTYRLIDTQFGEEITITEENVTLALKKAISKCNDNMGAIVEATLTFSKENFDINKSIKYFELLTNN